MPRRRQCPPSRAHRVPESLLASSSPKEKRLALPKAPSATFAFAPCLMSGDGVGGRGRPTDREGGERATERGRCAIHCHFVCVPRRRRGGREAGSTGQDLGCRIMVKLFDVLKVQRMQIFRQPGKSPLAWPGTAGTRQRDSERMEMEREAPLRILKPSGPSQAKEGGGRAGEQ